jgi:hypothetical protein
MLIQRVLSTSDLTCNNLKSPSFIACRIPSLLRSPNLVSPLQKRASTDLISQENLISGYRADMARPLPEQMQCSFCQVHAHSWTVSLLSTCPLADRLLSNPFFPTSRTWPPKRGLDRLPVDAEGSNLAGSASWGWARVSSRAENVIKIHLKFIYPYISNILYAWCHIPDMPLTSADDLLGVIITSH